MSSIEKCWAFIKKLEEKKISCSFETGGKKKQENPLHPLKKGVREKFLSPLKKGIRKRNNNFEIDNMKNPPFSKGVGGRADTLFKKC